MSKLRKMVALFIICMLVIIVTGCGERPNGAEAGNADNVSNEPLSENEVETDSATSTQTVEEKNEQVDNQDLEENFEVIDENNEDQEEVESSPDLVVTGYRVSRSEDYTTLGVTVKNNTNLIICTPTITIGTLDNDNNVLDSFELQAMVALLPDQTITLSDFLDIGDAVSFFVDSSGWIEYEDEIYDVEVGGHLEPISLDENAEEFEPSEKSSINCIDGDVANEPSGQDVGVSVTDMHIEDDGDYVMCYATIRNDTDETIKTVTAHSSLMDSNGNILGWSMMQEMISVAPGKTVTLSSYEDLEGIAYFTISYCAYDIGDDYYSGYIKTIPQAASR